MYVPTMAAISQQPFSKMTAISNMFWYSNEKKSPESCLLYNTWYSWLTHTWFQDDPHWAIFNDCTITKSHFQSFMVSMFLLNNNKCKSALLQDPSVFTACVRVSEWLDLTAFLGTERPLNSITHSLTRTACVRSRSCALDIQVLQTIWTLGQVKIPHCHQSQCD